MLTCENLTCIKQDRILFEGLSFTLSNSEILHVVGENGAGKTSLLRLVAGLAETVSGAIFWGDDNVAEINTVFLSDMLYLGHKLALQPNLSAIENIQSWVSMQSGNMHLDIIDILNTFGLVGLEDLPVRMLSAGQQRRVSLSRLLCKQTKLWILDEPFTSLDKAAVTMLIQLLKTHQQNGGMTLITSHNSLPEELDVKLLNLEYRF